MFRHIIATAIGIILSAIMVKFVLWDTPIGEIDRYYRGVIVFLSAIVVFGCNIVAFKEG